MNVWTVSNQKGGVGKTTSVATLGGLLASWGFNTLLIDLDPHGSLTSYFRIHSDEIEHSVYDLFKNASAKKLLDPSPYIRETAHEGLFILPSVTALASLDRQAATTDGLGLVIENSLSIIKGQFDYVLIDSPPTLGILMINALAACDHLVLPVVTEFLALKGLERMVQTLLMIRKSRNFQLDYTIVPTMFDQRTRASVQSLHALREQYPDQLWDSVIPIDTKIRDASQAGIPASLYYPKSRAAVAYGNLLDYLLGRPANKQSETDSSTANLTKVG